MTLAFRSAAVLLTLLSGAACAPPEKTAETPVPAEAVSVVETEAPARSEEPIESPAEPAAPDEWVAMETDRGEILINLFEELTPAHAENFKKLVRQGWFDGTPFHRVVPGFIAQGGGHWIGDGPVTSDVGYEIAHEIRGELRHIRGALAAARKVGPANPSRRSSGSQFYICLRPQPEFDLQYTVFGQVIDGLDVVDRLKSAPPGKDGELLRGEASVILRAWIRPANEPGSAAPVDHSDHAGRSGQH